MQSPTLYYIIFVILYAKPRKEWKKITPRTAFKFPAEVILWLLLVDQAQLLNIWNWFMYLLLIFLYKVTAQSWIANYHTDFYYPFHTVLLKNFGLLWIFSSWCFSLCSKSIPCLSFTFKWLITPIKRKSSGTHKTSKHCDLRIDNQKKSY